MDQDEGYSWHRAMRPSDAEVQMRLATGPVPIEGKVLAALLCLTFSALLATQLIDGTEQQWIQTWGVSWTQLANGRYETVMTHMVTHAGLIHLALNSMAVWVIVPMVVGHMGIFPSNIVRFIIFSCLCGLAGLVTFLLLHINGTMPMVGASGAICGLVGMLWRVCPDTRTVLPLLSRRTWLLTTDFVKDHIPLLLIFVIPALVSGQGGGVAWEAHLGGLLFGLIAGPYFIWPLQEPQDVV